MGVVGDVRVYFRTSGMSRYIDYFASAVIYGLAIADMDDLVAENALSHKSEVEILRFCRLFYFLSDFRFRSEFYLRIDGYTSTFPCA